MDNVAIVHISDLHYMDSAAYEGNLLVLDAFVKDIMQQFEALEAKNKYLAISGDIVKAGGVKSQYDSFKACFIEKLNLLGFDRSHIILVPGNHDMGLDYVRTNLINHEGVVALGLDEKDFNEYILGQNNVLLEKFDIYKQFEADVTNFGVNGQTMAGAGHGLSDDFGVYCLNSALCSSGSLEYKGEKIIDEGRLGIDTRSLLGWIKFSEFKFNILIMHHPIAWLMSWAESELKIIIKNNFNLLLSGHNHSQEVFHKVYQDSNVVECSAPPLFTNKYDKLGYAIILLDSKHGVNKIVYRQWSQNNHKFLPGIDFSGTENGVLDIVKPKISQQKMNIEYVDYIKKLFENNLDEALQSFSSQPIVWVSPVLCDKPEFMSQRSEIKTIQIEAILNRTTDYIIKAPPQFGLTCLSHYLIKEAWINKNEFWLYIDSVMLKPSLGQIKSVIEKSLNKYSTNFVTVKCFVLDGWSSRQKDAVKILQKFIEATEAKDIVVMQTIESDELIKKQELDLARKFQVLHLWALTKNHIRNFVSKYNDARLVGDEDIVLEKVVSDLAALNLHRTPLNCLTLLRVSEAEFEDSPVNRTEVIRRFLLVVFNDEVIPIYRVKPDLKDCEYVLGYFCEFVVRKGMYLFTRDEFLQILQRCCNEKLIDIDIHVVFDVLFSNHIIVRRTSSFFSFRYSYWIYYFCAHRMHHSAEFEGYIFEEMRYAKFPEIIEFYTGIDRRRENALRILITDINKVIEKVNDKCGIPDDVNPYKFAAWEPSKETLEQMEKELFHGVQESNLPASVKDGYADRLYDRKKPYDQEIRDILSDHSFVFMMQSMRAGARALRNSDYADPIIKKELMDSISRCLDVASKVLFILLPILANDGFATFDGAAFQLQDNFDDDPQQRFLEILSCIPTNVVTWVQDDLFSQKMGPLLVNCFKNEKSELTRHRLVLLMIHKRPRDWKSIVNQYIATINKNSFYLCDIYMALKTQYVYGYATNQQLRDLEYLIKMAAAKHQFGAKSPGEKMIGKIPNNVLPERKID